MNSYTLDMTLEALVASVCWVIVSLGFGLAVYSRRVKDTVLESVALSTVCIAAAGTAYRISKSGTLAEQSMWLGVAIAAWVVVIAIKTMRQPAPKDESSEPTTLY